MINALTYEKMIKKINSNYIERGLRNDYIGVFITRPDLESGKSILNSLNYYHHLTGRNVNFYLPGFGSYWGENYPDKETVAKIDGTEWYFSNEQFVKFTRKLERKTKWVYSGESELILLPLIEGKIDFQKILIFYLDDMLRDGAIKSVSAFFQQLSRLFESKSTLSEIHVALCKDNAIELIKGAILKKLPHGIGDIITKEKYFVIMN